jgi:hypothetical protein
MWPHKVRPGYKEIPFEVDYDLVPRLYPEPSIWQRLWRFGEKVVALFDEDE